MANNTDWLYISPMSGGTGTTSLSLTALTNSSLSAKTATITAKNTTYNVSGTSTVTIQGFAPTLTLSRSTLRFDSTGGTATFTVYSNTSWTITYPALVHSYSTSAGTGDTEVTVVLAPNPDEVAKIDTGIVKDTFNVNQLYLTIVQESFIAELTVTPDDDITFVNTGSTTSVTIDTNTDWEIECPSWVTPSVISGTSGTTTVTFTAGENGPNDRSGTIIIYAGSKSVEINVFQPFYIPPYITVTPSAWTFTYTEDGRSFIVDSYPDWTADVILTGETVWASDTYMEAVFEVPSSVTIKFYNTYSGSTTAIYVGPVKQFGTSFVTPSSGTYIVRYEMPSGGTTPAITNNQYLKEVHLTDKVGVIRNSGFTGCSALSSVTIGTGLTTVGSAAFYGCSSLASISVAAPVAPSVCGDTFFGVASGGTLNYPGGSDYSVWLGTGPYYLGFMGWNGIVPSFNFDFTITYNVTSTGNTRILGANGDSGWDYPVVYAVRDEEGNIKPLGKGDIYYKFSSTGKQSLDLAVTSSYTVSISGLTNMTDVIVNENGTGRLNISGGGSSFTGLTIYRDNGLYTGYTSSVKKLVITGSTSSMPSKSFINITKLTDVEVFGNVTSFPNGYFKSATTLTSVTLSNKINSLSYECFDACSSLQRLTIPSSVTGVGQYFIDHCSSLTSITCLSVTAPTLSYNAFYGFSTQNGTLYYPTGSNYSSWFNARLSSLGWTGVEI